MNRDTIKYIAMFTMLLNHIGVIFLKPPLAAVFIDIGYFTAISMCYFLVEGYRYTGSRKKYALRLLIFALVSQIPFSLAFASGTAFSLDSLNVMFNLFFCFLLIHVFYSCHDSGKRGIYSAGLIFLSVFCDWSFLAPVFVLLFLWAGNSQERKIKAWLWAILLFGLYNFMGYMSKEGLSKSLILCFGAMMGQMAAAFCILFAYNGKRAVRFRRFSQWFFYLFYPGHLLVLWAIRIMLGVC